MIKYHFSHEYILSLERIKKEGILYDEEKFSFESYWENGFNHYERLFVINENGDSKPFTGLLYELFPNGNLNGIVKEVLELSDHSRHKKFVEYDENGNIVRQGEK